MKNSIIALAFALVPSASFASSMSEDFKVAVYEATVIDSVQVDSDVSMAEENRAAVLYSTSFWDGFRRTSEGSSMADEYQAAVLEAVGFWN